MQTHQNKNIDTATASQAIGRASARINAQATACASCRPSSLFASMVAVVTMALGASALAGVNLANDAKPPGYSQPLTVYQRDGKIYAAWAVGSNGSLNAGAFQVGFYVRGQRQLVATFQNGLPRGYMGFLGYLPAMSGTLNSATSAGVDCSGSISIAWELPARLSTGTFDVASSSYFTTVVSNGKLAANASKIQPGDAIVSASWQHMVMALSAPVNGKVEVLEATADYGRNLNGERQSWAVVKNTRSLSDLDANNCRVVRRNKLQ